MGKRLNRNEILSLLASLRGQIGMVLDLTAYSEIEIENTKTNAGSKADSFKAGTYKAGSSNHKAKEGGAAIFI